MKTEIWKIIAGQFVFSELVKQQTTKTNRRKRHIEIGAQGGHIYGKRRYERCTETKAFLLADSLNDSFFPSKSHLEYPREQIAFFCFVLRFIILFLFFFIFSGACSLAWKIVRVFIPKEATRSALLNERICKDE